MPGQDLTTRLKWAGIVAFFTFGFTALLAVLDLPLIEELVPVVTVFGWFILAPAVALFGVPAFVEETLGTTDAAGGRTTGREPDGESADDPLATLRERYAAGEISEAEFDRKVERLLETDPGQRDPIDAPDPGSFAGSLDDPDRAATPDPPGDDRSTAEETDLETESR